MALTPVLLLTLVSRWAEGAFAMRVGAYAIAALGGSAFGILGVIAIHGVVMLLAPPGRALALSAMLRSVMLCALVLCLPWLFRLPAEGSALAMGSRWLLFAPPAWFVGAEEYLRGNHRPHFVALARVAALALITTTASVVMTYAWLYGHFDRLMARPAGGSVGRGTWGFGFAHQWPRSWRRRIPHTWARSARLGSRDTPFIAVRTFILMTLRRSVLHQGIAIVLSAIGGGLVANSYLVSGVIAWLQSGGAPQPKMIASALWAPFALMYIACRAVRLALRVPVEPRANWILRMTERDLWRANQLKAAAQIVRVLGVIAPIALTFPFQWLMLGMRAIPVLIATALCGFLYVELLMKDWARIPFTCSYIPGKQFVPQAVLIAIASFGGFAAARHRHCAMEPAARHPRLGHEPVSLGRHGCAAPQAGYGWLTDAARIRGFAADGRESAATAAD